MLAGIQTVGIITNLNLADGGMESRKACTSGLFVPDHITACLWQGQMHDISLAYNYASHAEMNAHIVMQKLCQHYTSHAEVPHTYHSYANLVMHAT